MSEQFLKVDEYVKADAVNMGMFIATFQALLKRKPRRIQYIESGEWFEPCNLTPEIVARLAGGQDAPIAVRSLEQGKQVCHYCIVSFREGRPRLYSAIDMTPIDGLHVTGWLPARFFDARWQHARRENVEYE